MHDEIVSSLLFQTDRDRLKTGTSQKIINNCKRKLETERCVFLKSYYTFKFTMRNYNFFNNSALVGINETDDK